MFQNISDMIIVTGHYGSGKTNFSVNLALDLKKQGRNVCVVDLDIVNPYFRTADFGELFVKEGIEIITPTYANTNLDIPALSSEIYSVFNRENTTIIFDVGGDDDGAIALGRYANLFKQKEYTMLYVVNLYRYVDPSSQESVELLHAIETTSRLKVSGIINNSNLSESTTEQIVLDSVRYAQEIACEASLPLLATTTGEELADALTGKVENLYPIKRYVVNPWEK